MALQAMGVRNGHAAQNKGATFHQWMGINALADAKRDAHV
jgi:hypothetical protein